jgi:hypothetical protein
MNVDLNATKADGKLTVKSEDKTSPFELEVTFNAKATDKPVSIQKPTDATPIEKIIEPLMVAPVPANPATNNTPITPLDETPILSDPSVTDPSYDNSTLFDPTIN